MKRQPILLLIVSDFIGFAVIAGVGLLLGLTVNCLRPEPLALFEFRLSGPEANLPVPSVPEMTLNTLKELIGRHGVHVIDARPADFFALGHIPGAINLPLSELQTYPGEARISISKDDPLVVYCADVSCPAAKSVARILETLGYRQVVLFPGGWYAWKEAGLPMEANP